MFGSVDVFICLFMYSVSVCPHPNHSPQVKHASLISTLKKNSTSYQIDISISDLSHCSKIGNYLE